MRIISACTILALSAVAAVAAAAADYSTTPSLCSGGHRTTDDDRTMSVGNGAVSIGSMNCEREGSKRDLGKDWFTANWSCSVEGEPLEEPVAFDLRIADGVVDLRYDGQVTRYQQCG